MSEEKKPKKDLRARLGRTIAPNTPGAPPIAAPGGVIAPPAAAPAAAPTAAPSSAGAVAAPAPPVAAPVLTPPMASPNKMPFGPDIAPPPFARPAVVEAPKPEPRRRAADPFAAGPAQSDQVRLVIEEKPVDESIARGARSRNLAIITVGVLAGIGLGTWLSTVNAQHNLYNLTVRDAHAARETLVTASDVVTQANTHLEAVATAAAGGADHHPTVSYDDIAALRALANPLHQGAFARKNYNRFDAATVDDLFLYEHNVAELWTQFEQLTAITSGPARQYTLNQTAAATTCPADLGHDEASATAAMQAARAATTDDANAQYVALLNTDDDGNIQGTLGFAEADLDHDTHLPTTTGAVFMRGTRTGAGRAFTPWTPAVTIGSAPAGLVVVDGPASTAVIGDRVGAFRSFATALEETRALMRETMEIQQRLLAATQGIDNLEEELAL